MSKFSLPSSDAVLLVRDTQGHYGPASPDQILDAARCVIDQKMPRGVCCDQPETVKEFVRAKLAGFEFEVFSVLYLDVHLKLIEYVEMFRGSIASTSVYPREVVKEALRLGASFVVLAHNHPTSGSPEPSPADLALTQQLKSALALLEVRVSDHVIVAGNAAVSFLQRGLI
jgi:DNA repair protein RadC